MSTSCVITPLNLSMRESSTSFFQPKAYDEQQRTKQRLTKLADDYAELDDQFEEEIVKNVQLKAQLAHLKEKL